MTDRPPGTNPDPGDHLERQVHLTIAHNPDPTSRLPYLLWVPLGDGLVFRVKDTWPRTAAVYCHPVATEEWPDEPEVIERLRLTVCRRRGAAIDLVVDRAREQRSQLVFTTARGREAVFWQAPRTRKKARPQVRTPTARASGVPDLTILVDTRERYPFRFTRQQVTTVARALPVGDYGLAVDGRLVAAVERKTLPDLASSLTSGKLTHVVAELAGLPRAAVVVEQRYAEVFGLEHVRPATVADGLAELQVRTPEVPVVFCGTRQLAEEWTYRFLGAAAVWARSEPAAVARLGSGRSEVELAPPAPAPAAAELRAWAREQGLAVSDRGRIAREVREAWDRHHAVEERE